MEQYKILKDLIGFNTIKDKENKQIIEYIENILIGKGFKTEYKEKNLIMSIGENPKLGFLGHTDTVEYISGWDTSPFELTKKENKLYGLGVCDMKGGFAAFLDAIIDIDFNKLKYGIKVYFTYDEEIGFSGVYDIVKSKEKFPELMIFGEPTNNKILVGSKGLLEYELYFNGVKAHSSNPEKGKSANLNAIKFLTELDEFYNQNIKKFKEKKYEVPYTTMNIGILNGGSAKNSTAAKCEASLDFRIANKEHIEIIKNKVNKLSKKYDCDVNIIESIEPFIDDIEFVKDVNTAGFITEASMIKGCKRMILGTGPVTAHEINEYITENSYNLLIKQYKEIIEKVCN